MIDDTRPFSPHQAALFKAQVIPVEVIQTVNRLLSERFTNEKCRIIIKQDEVIAAATELLRKNDPEQSHLDPEVTQKNFRNDFFDKGWLNFEPLFIQSGWTVSYDKPGYNETYSAFWEFTAAKRPSL